MAHEMVWNVQNLEVLFDVGDNNDVMCNLQQLVVTKIDVAVLEMSFEISFLNVRICSRLTIRTLVSPKRFVHKELTFPCDTGKSILVSTFILGKVVKNFDSKCD